MGQTIEDKARKLFRSIDQVFSTEDQRVIAEQYFIHGFCYKANSKQKKEKPVVPYYKEFIEIWDRYYPRMLTFPVDGGKIKSIIEKVIKYSDAIAKAKGGGSVDPVAVWERFVQRLKENSFYHNKNLSKIDSGFWEIIKQYEQGNASDKFHSSPSGARDYIDSLRRSGR